MHIDDCKDRFKKISENVTCLHNKDQMNAFINSLFDIPLDKEGCIVEAGCFKGGSTAKFSIAAKMINRKLIVFDSFQGLPEKEGNFTKGKYPASLDEVKDNVKKYGEIDVCEFIEGWFKDTMPNFSEKICAAYLDVDLSSSAKICLKYLYPLIIPKGILYSHDGDHKPVAAVYNDDEFWEKEVGCKKPFIDGLGNRKLINIIKDEKI